MEYDSIVIGAGSGGLSFCRKASDLGAKVLIVEKGPLGGTCVNRGCVPKKLLWDAAWSQAKAAALQDTGIATRPGLSFPDLAGGISKKITAIHQSYADDLKAETIRHITGMAELDADGTVRVNGERFRATNIVLATGARPSSLDIEGSELLLTSDDVLSWTALPDSLIILGAGYIGCEFAAIFDALGVSVTLVDPGDRILDGFDQGLAAIAQDIMEARGIDVRLGAKPARVEGGAGVSTVVLDTGDRLSASQIVNATGRTPNVDGLGPISERLTVADSGALAISDRFETSCPGIYAIGDCSDRLPLTPVATRDGETLAHILHGAGRAAIDLGRVTTAAFVMPPIAQVGDLKGSDLATGFDLREGALTGDDHWTARTARRLTTSGGALKGVAFMTEAADDLIAPFAALIGHDADALSAATGVHPSFGEELTGD